jgi:hypothetical protein
MDGYGMMNAKDFGAKGDGQADDTAALQAALDQAAQSQGTVFLPEGVYLSGELRFASHVGICGLANRSFQKSAGAVVKLNDPSAKGLLNLTGALGVGVRDLCLDGGSLPGETHGILFDKPDFGKEEDTPQLENLFIEKFSGDGVHLGRIWCFSIRHCHFYRNGGCGVWLHGWDGFILDNWFTANGKAGFGAYQPNSAITFTGNRVEWNRDGGVVVWGGKNYNLTGNYFDQSFAGGLVLLPRREYPCVGFAVTGNIFNRSGKTAKRPLTPHENSHARFEGVRGLAFVGNCMRTGQNDKQTGPWSPDYGIVFSGLTDTVIKDNALHEGALKALLADLGGHGENVVVKDNVGCLKSAE